MMFDRHFSSTYPIEITTASQDDVRSQITGAARVLIAASASRSLLAESLSIAAGRFSITGSVRPQERVARDGNALTLTAGQLTPRSPTMSQICAATPATKSAARRNCARITSSRYVRPPYRYIFRMGDKQRDFTAVPPGRSPGAAIASVTPSKECPCLSDQSGEGGEGDAAHCLVRVLLKLREHDGWIFRPRTTDHPPFARFEIAG